MSVVLGQAYDQEALISHFNENADNFDWIEDCETVTNRLETEAAFAVQLAERIEAGERFALGGQGRELTDWSDETWANFLALTFRAVELGC